MLNFVFGRSGYGKTEYVFNMVKKTVSDDNEDVLLITPEQYSLVAERKLLELLGEADITRVNNSSFSRLADEVNNLYGREMLPTLSKGGRAVIMIQAIKICSPDFLLFNKNIDTFGFVNSMLKVYDEMKSCNLDGEQISSMCKNIDNVALYNKMRDISAIMSAYDSIIKDRYLDSADDLTRLYNKIKDKKFFKDKNVFIDGFNGFVAQEYKLLELIISEAKSVIITLCTDGKNIDDSYSLFSYVNNTVKIIEKIANKADIQIQNTFLEKNHRTNDETLITIEKSFFKETENAVKNNSVEIYAAQNISDECFQLSRQIRTLMRNGYRAKDIAIICRNLDTYNEEIGYSFRKYEIPYYYDERQPIVNQPLVVFIMYLFRCINFSYQSDDILSLLKTELTDIDNEDINELENYVYLWNINGSKWKKPFDKSTKGLVGIITDKDRNSLDSINATRERIIAPILSFRNDVKDGTPIQICEQIYNMLIKFGVDKRIREYAIELNRLNKPILANEQGRVWDIVMSVLDYLPKTLPDSKISLKEFAKLFNLVISAEDMGAIPAGLDNVQLGQADRIRTNNPKAVFILGANEGEFPQAVSGGGLLSEKDRRILLEKDFKLYSYAELLDIQEKYFAYMACTAPSEKLFISYTSNSKQNAPSEIITSIKNVVDISEKNYISLDDIDLIETKTNAFELMSERYHKNTVFYSSLKKYFEDDERFIAVKNLAENKDVSINNKDLAKKLFSYDMNVSASRIEDYYNCPFRYFCKFGLNARPRTKAEIDPMQRGTLIHYVLENILARYGSKKLSEMQKPQIMSIVDELIEEYISANLNNATDFEVRFDYNFKRLSRLIYSVVYHLAEEFKNSDFEAQAFELDIDKDGSVKPQILTLDDGGTIQIRGSIDRVDSYTKDGVSYIRVVDYKSGNKTFKLSDIIYGLNLQMFVYLFSLCEDKNAKLNGVPAGVLYMHAARDLYSFDAKSRIDKDMEQKENSSFKMKGLVINELNGEIAIAMEHDLNGRYIPVKYKKNGDLSGNLASLAEFGYLQRKVNEHIKNMGVNLHNGLIPKNPVKNSSHKKTCEFCDYKDVCATKRNIEYRVTEELSDAQVKESLAEEYATDGKVD
ncbi:MAG: PD-(D/E)XK nuclease family protein [Eubacterium sp.]|nr:PD-(D/E)XK nuclease family protein [Eubacterium sp.]